LTKKQVEYSNSNSHHPGFLEQGDTASSKCPIVLKLALHGDGEEILVYDAVCIQLHTEVVAKGAGFPGELNSISEDNNGAMGPRKLGDVPMMHIGIPSISRWLYVVVLNRTKPASLYKNVLAPTDSDLRYACKNALDTIVTKTYI
jgi:hypothetical protein